VRMPVFNRSLAMLLVAVAAGLFAAWAARQHIQNRILQIEHDAKVPMAQRVVAAFDLPAGTRLDTEHLAVRQMPAALVSSGSIAPEGFSSLLGHTLVAPLRAGDPILPVHTARARSAPFSDQLGNGRRAITMPVDAINSVSGLLEPGDFIDLYVSFEHQRRRVTAPLLQGVLVLATGGNTRPGSDGPGSAAEIYSTVTLDTSPEDAIKLVAARQSGTITALLRRPDDHRSDPRAVRGDLASLIGVGAAAPAIAAKPKRAPVIYGNQAARSVPALRPSSAGRAAPSNNGVFNLPYTPELVSAWLGAQKGRPGSPASDPQLSSLRDLFAFEPPQVLSESGYSLHGASGFDEE